MTPPRSSAPSTRASRRVAEVLAAVPATLAAGRTLATAEAGANTLAATAEANGMVMVIMPGAAAIRGTGAVATGAPGKEGYLFVPFDELCIRSSRELEEF